MNSLIVQILQITCPDSWLEKPTVYETEHWKQQEIDIRMDETQSVLFMMILVTTLMVTSAKTCVSYKIKRNISYDPGSCTMVDLDSTVTGVNCVQRCSENSTVRMSKVKIVKIPLLFFCELWKCSGGSSITKEGAPIPRGWACAKLLFGNFLPKTVWKCRHSRRCL